ncbi:MAG TPA: hypothetical protein VGE12_13265 [Noviherbaspirillum sp.]
MFVHTTENHSWLRARWQALMTRLGAHRSEADATWDNLVRHYSEAHRAYHNLSHIMALLRQADSERVHVTRPDVIELAIWFHDVIYDTHARDNELRSATWARHAMTAMGIEPEVIKGVEQCILATEKHELPSPHIADLPLFLDLDLAILGASEESYRRYAQVIRAEYDWVPEQEYRSGRAAVLKRLIERPALYRTPEMAERYEARARRNIAWELQELGVT